MYKYFEGSEHEIILHNNNTLAEVDFKYLKCSKDDKVRVFILKYLFPRLIRYALCRSLVKIFIDENEYEIKNISFQTTLTKSDVIDKIIEKIWTNEEYFNHKDIPIKSSPTFIVVDKLECDIFDIIKLCYVLGNDCFDVNGETCVWKHHVKDDEMELLKQIW